MNLPKLLETVKAIDNSRENLESKVGEMFADYLIEKANNSLTKYIELTESLYVNDFPNQDATYIIGKISQCAGEIYKIRREISWILNKK